MTLRVVKAPSREPSVQAAVWGIRKAQYLKARRWDALVEMIERAGDETYPDPITENARKVLNQHVGRILTEIDEELAATDANINKGRTRVDPANPYQLRVIWENYANWFRHMSDPKNLRRGTERLTHQPAAQLQRKATP